MNSFFVLQFPKASSKSLTNCTFQLIPFFAHCKVSLSSPLYFDSAPLLIMCKPYLIHKLSEACLSAFIELLLSLNLSPSTGLTELIIKWLCICPPSI